MNQTLVDVEKCAYGKVFHVLLLGKGEVVLRPLICFFTNGQCDIRPVVTFSAERHHYSLTGTKLYCVVTEVNVKNMSTVIM